MSGRGTQGEGFGGLSSGIGEPFVFVAACFSRANMSLSVESIRVESLVKILWYVSRILRRRRTRRPADFAYRHGRKSPWPWRQLTPDLLHLTVGVGLDFVQVAHFPLG